MKSDDTKKEQHLLETYQESNKLTAITYNVFGGYSTEFRNERQNAIVEEIVAFGNLAGDLELHEVIVPDIICLQEVTLETVDLLTKKTSKFKFKCPIPRIYIIGLSFAQTKYSRKWPRGQ